MILSEIFSLKLGRMMTLSPIRTIRIWLGCKRKSDTPVDHPKYFYTDAELEQLAWLDEVNRGIIAIGAAGVTMQEFADMMFRIVGGIDE